MPDAEPPARSRRGLRGTAARALVRVASRVDPAALPAAEAPRPAGRPSGPPPSGGCLVCHAPADRVVRREVVFALDERFRKTVNSCRRCGYVAIDEISSDIYRGSTSVDELPRPTTRMGTTERPGREFQMASMGLDILGRTRPQDVLVYGAGNSLDNHHIQQLPGAGTVSIGDIMKIRDDAPFVDANRPGDQRFPLVVASEVIEHFRDPWTDFTTLFGLVGPRGLLVCGTDVHGGGRVPLARHRYVFHADHTSYYSARSLRRIAEGLGFHVDFRAVDGLGPRKRYVLFTRSPEVLARISVYFGGVKLAPTEMTYQRRAERAAAQA